jgi:Na+-translocating ferredoxin:NAD+ oxidoreductase subunit B
MFIKYVHLNIKEQGMNDVNDVYARIAAMWRMPGSQRLMRILKAGFTPEEGEIMLHLSTYTTCEQLAKKLGLDEKSVQSRLDGLSRGWVFSRDGSYMSVPNAIAIIPHSVMPGVPEEEKKAMWMDIFRTDEYQSWQLESWVRLSKISGQPIHRILPARRALTASPGIRPEQILWYEDMPEILKRAKHIYVGPCGCRSVWGVCDHPMETCLGVAYSEPPAAGKGLPPRKEITPAEAQAIIEECEDRAMLNIPPNTAMAQMFCNCCPCCCEIVYPYNKYGGEENQAANLSPSRFRASIDRDICSGCQTCLERCHFSAIEMAKAPGSKKLKAQMINEECMGCGLCVIGCPQKAITLEMVRPPGHIPNESGAEMEARRSAYPNWLNPAYSG